MQAETCRGKMLSPRRLFVSRMLIHMARVPQRTDEAAIQRTKRERTGHQDIARVEGACFPEAGAYTAAVHRSSFWRHMGVQDLIAGMLGTYTR